MRWYIQNASIVLGHSNHTFQKPVPELRLKMTSYRPKKIQYCSYNIINFKMVGHTKHITLNYKLKELESQEYTEEFPLPNSVIGETLQIAVPNKKYEVIIEKEEQGEKI